MVKIQPPPRQPIELWSYAKISEHTGISTGTLRQWRNRDKMPAADYTVGEYLAWAPTTIRNWWEQVSGDQRDDGED